MAWFSKGTRWMPLTGGASRRRFSWGPLHAALLISVGLHAWWLAQTWPRRENVEAPRLSATLQVRQIAAPAAVAAAAVTAPERGRGLPVMTAQRAPRPVTPARAAQEMPPAPAAQTAPAPAEPSPPAPAPPVPAVPPGIAISSGSGWDYPVRRRAFGVPDARVALQDVQSQAFEQAQHARRQEVAVQAARWLLADLQQRFPEGPDLVCEVGAGVQCQPEQPELASFIQQRWDLLRGMHPGLPAIRAGRTGGSWQFMGF